MGDRFVLYFWLMIIAAGLALAGLPNQAEAHHCKGQHKNDLGCPDSGDGGGGASDTISVMVTIDDIAGDHLLSDGGPYVDGVDKITAQIDDRGFRMTPENKSSRTSTIDFGALVDCSSGIPDIAGDCIMDSVQGFSIECPIPVEIRLEDQCKGVRTIYLFFRDVFLDEATTTNILSMPADGIQYSGQHGHHEISITAPAKEKNSWGLIFKRNPGLMACGNIAENLGIAAFDDNNDGVTDRWEISTDTVDGPAKIACLAKSSPSSTTFEGYVEMQFGFQIERLP